MATEEIDSVQQAFEQFERQVVRVPQAENEAAKEVHPQVRETLKQELPEHLETFLHGSYSRKVQVVRIKDIDIIVVPAWGSHRECVPLCGTKKYPFDTLTARRGPCILKAKSVRRRAVMIVPIKATAGRAVRSA